MRTVLGVCSALAVVLTAHSSSVLAHWPDQPPHQIAHLGDLQLEAGGVLTNFKMSYVTHGRLNAAKDNAILFMHGFGANHHLLDHLIGPGRSLDTDKYFIICSDSLGNTQTSFEHNPSICSAPQYLAEEFLRLDGFTDVEYLPLGARNGPRALAEGRADITMWDAPGLIPHLDAGRPIVLLARVHTGCYELFGNERVHALRDLKEKTVAVQFVGGGDHVLVSSMLAYIGMNPQQDVNWIVGEDVRDTMGLFVDGKADAFLGFGQDRPWSDYFCCMVAANRQFAERHPIATKRVLRAILRATDICASEPQRAARYLADKLYEPRFQLGLEVMKSLPYNRWREGNAEDTLRFHALRLHQVGMIKTNPSKLIAQSTNWRFLNELKKELKG